MVPVVFSQSTRVTSFSCSPESAPLSTHQRSLPFPPHYLSRLSPRYWECVTKYTQLIFEDYRQLLLLLQRAIRNMIFPKDLLLSPAYIHIFSSLVSTLLISHADFLVNLGQAVSAAQAENVISALTDLHYSIGLFRTTVRKAENCGLSLQSSLNNF